MSEKTSNMKKGKAYEKFSREILLLDNLRWGFRKVHFDIVSNLGVIDGKSGASHQIDVHLTSSKYPKYHLICECKAHTGGVEKTHACSFVTVIRDIKKKHKNWKIIPVFTSDDGYDPGAYQVLKYFKINSFEMKDYREKTAKMTIGETSTSAILKNLKAKLSDGSIVDDSKYFVNFARGDIWGISNIIGFFEVFDDNENLIEDLVEYKGRFHTGKRKIYHTDEDDEFYYNHSDIKLVSIEGEVIDKKVIAHNERTEIIKSSIITYLKMGDGYAYKFSKDGSCKKIEIE